MYVTVEGSSWAHPISRSCEMAIKMLRQVAERGQWGLVVHTARDAYLTGHLELALEQYAVAAEMGLVVAVDNVAYLWETGMLLNVKKNFGFRHAFRLHKKLAAEGYGISNKLLGDYYHYGIGNTIIKNDTAALEFYETASLQGELSATFELAMMYHVKGNLTLAEFYLNKGMVDNKISYESIPFYLTNLWWWLEDVVNSSMDKLWN